MLVLKDIESLRGLITSWRKSGEVIGFVPTMGYLHEGHTSLVKLAQKRATKTIASIFVNPAQFNDPKDFEKYPIDLPRDFSVLEEIGTDAVFIPTKDMIYGPDFQSWVELGDITKLWEGASRPGHFRGVSTVVSILFHLVEPSLAVFGEKDFQQLRVIETMVKDLHMNIEIVRGPIVREHDGLAMSSRNVRLSPEARKIAPRIFESLNMILECIKAGENKADALILKAKEHLASFPEINIDYLSIVDERTLLPLKEVKPLARIITTMSLGGIRLLDNMQL